MKKYKLYGIIIFLILVFCVVLCFVPIDATRFIPEVEKQAMQDMGVQVHIEKLIFRFGPSLKIKAPVMHVMYEDGQKFGQLDNVKFYVPWSTLYRDDVVLNKIYADMFILKLKSDDKYLSKLIQRLNEKEYKENPNVQFKKYSIMYNDVEQDKMYTLSGNYLDLTKIENYESLKLNTEGTFFINEKPHINYNLSIQPNLKYSKEDLQTQFNLKNFAEQVEALDFHSDIIADVKLFKNKDELIQMSGLVNVDNISVLDIEKKNPKSFIYLTFLGNKTGILSNIYASSDKKICAEGSISNTKKPEIDLKVKTDNIKIADIYSKVKLFVDMSKYKGIEAVGGNISADFNIKGDFNKLKSNGYLKITDALIKANGININKINSDVDFSNNIVSISNAIGYVNNAPIMIKGQINKEINLQLLMDKVELSLLVPEKYGIKGGIISLNALVNGTLDNIKHNENIHVEGFKAEKSDTTLSFDNLSMNTNQDKAAYITNIVVKPKLAEKIKLPMLKLQIEEDKIKIPETDIYMPNSKLQAKAEILNYNTNKFLFTLGVNGFVNSKDLSGITKNSAIYPVKLNVNGSKEVQNIDAQLQLLKAAIIEEPALINLSASAENGNLKIEDLSLLPFNDNFSSNLKANIKTNKKLIISGNIENLSSPVFKNIRLFIPQQLNINVQNTIAQLKGDLFINGKINQPEIVGQISASNVINQFLQLTMSNLTVDFNKNVAVINAPVIKLADSSLGLNSTVSTDFSKKIHVKNTNVKSKYLNFDTLLMYKDIPLLTKYPVVLNDGKLYAERASATLYGKSLYFSALNADFKFENNILTAKNITSDLYNGKLAGSLDYNLKNDGFSSKLQARGISAAPIFNVVIQKNDTLSGAMDFDAELSGNMLSKQSLNGVIKFIVHNGHMGMLGKLEHLLFAQNVIADSMLRTSLNGVIKAITLRDTGLFKFLRGNLTIKDGIADIHSLQSQGPLMSLFIKGQYNPMIDYGKLVVLGRLSDEMIDALGAFGQFSVNKLMIILTGEENKLNIPAEDLDKLPPLPMKNTKEFRTVINGIVEKPSSVIQFNWISYSQKSLRQKEVPMSNEKIPDFIENLPY